jgi:hypothetical protein
MEKFRQARDATDTDSRAACQNAGRRLSTAIDVTQEHTSLHMRFCIWPESWQSSAATGPTGSLLVEPGYLHSFLVFQEQRACPCSFTWTHSTRHDNTASRHVSSPAD